MRKGEGPREPEFIPAFHGHTDTPRRCRRVAASPSEWRFPDWLRTQFDSTEVTDRCA